MAQERIPSEEELRQLYAQQINNTAIFQLSRWNEGNHSDECDDEVYLAKALTEGPALMEKFISVIDGI